MMASRRSLFAAALVACSLLLQHVSATAASSTPSGASAVEMAEASYPSCALECLGKLIPQSACSSTDVQCLCTNVPLNDNITICVSQGCTLMDQLATKNVSMTMCGAPVRNETAVPGLVAVIGGAFALLAFLLRMAVCSPWMGRSMGWEDYTIAVAVALTVPPTVFAVFLGHNGLGKDIWTLHLQQIENVLFYYYLGELFYVTAQAMIKVSLLFFLLRVFPEQKFRTACWITMGFVGVYGLVFFMVTVFQCWPIPYTWQQLSPTAHGKCQNENLQGWMSAIFNILLDLVILVLPMKQLYDLQMNWKKKLLSMFMFCLGVFVTIISIVRLRSLIAFANSSDITWAYLDAAYWSTIELDVGIITACLPAVRLFFVKIGFKTLMATTNKSSLSMSGHTSDGHQASSESKKGQASPRQGDERDFIPLVDVEHGKGYGKWRRQSSAVNDTRITVRTEITQDNSSEEDISGFEHGRPGKPVLL